MKLLKKQYFLFIFLLFSLPAHSFWGEQQIRSCLQWIYFSRISQFILTKLRFQSVQSPLSVIQTLLSKKDNLTFLNQLPENDQKSILTDSIYNDLTEKQKNHQLKTVTNLYQKDNLFSLATVYSILDTFINTQKRFLSTHDFTHENRNCKKDGVINNLFNQDEPSFYTERRILDENDSTYLAADLHGDPSPVLDILENLTMNNKFDAKTCTLSQNTYLSFNGDFVDKGINGSLCLLLIYSLKILNPKQVIITRGNHEDPDFLKIARISIDKKYDSKTLLDFGTELYYKYYDKISQIMNFIFPSDTLLKKISQSYAVMPVMAFMLHKNTSDKLCGFIASHAGLDPAYNPANLLMHDQEKLIVFDEYQTNYKLNPKNYNFQNALIDEIMADSKYEQVLNQYITTQIKSRLNDAETYKEFSEAINTSIEKLNTIDTASLKTYLNLSLSECKKTTQFDVSVESVIVKNNIPTLKTNPFNPFSCLFVVENCISYFEGPIKSIKDVAACWHWKEPHIKNPSSFKPTGNGSLHFNMSYLVFSALMHDYTKNTNVTLTLATQGHIQSAGLAFNEPYGLNQESIINNWGYGDSWDQEETQSTVNQLHSIKSHSIFHTKSFGYISANPCIAASCGSLYGCAQDQNEFEEYMRDKKDHIGPNYPYPGQWYNPIISLFYNSTTGRMNKHQALVWHKNQPEL